MVVSVIYLDGWYSSTYIDVYYICPVYMTVISMGTCMLGCMECIRNDHTTMTAPLPVCSAKLSIVWPGQYYGGGPRCNTRCCSFYTCTHHHFITLLTHKITILCVTAHTCRYYNINLINIEYIYPLVIMLFLNAYVYICNSQELHNHISVLHHRSSMNSTQFGSISKHTMNQNYTMNSNSNIYAGNITDASSIYTKNIIHN